MSSQRGDFMRTPLHYHHGGMVIVPARVAAWLTREARLDELRVRTMGTDPEVSAVLVALARAGAEWRSSVLGTSIAEPAEPIPSSTPMTTSDVADQLEITERGVRKAIATKRLRAELVGDRWSIAPEALAHFKASRRSA
jgi:hypothetical protein